MKKFLNLLNLENDRNYHKGIKINEETSLNVLFIINRCKI